MGSPSRIVRCAGEESRGYLELAAVTFLIYVTFLIEIERA